MINILKDFLSNRKQRVVLNSQCYFWAEIRFGVLQGSISGPLLCPIYIDDLSVGFKSECKLFAYDKPATLLKVTLLYGCCSRFLNCTNDTKSCKASHISKNDLSSYLQKKYE